MYAVTAIKPAATLKKFEVNCSSCNMRELCLPQALRADDMQRFEKVVYARRRIKRGETLFAAGDEFSAGFRRRVDEHVRSAGLDDLYLLRFAAPPRAGISGRR